MDSKHENHINPYKIIKYVMIYFLFTILMFDFGPNHYHADNTILLHVYVFTYFFAFYYGFRIISKRNTFNKNEYIKIKEKNDEKIEKILRNGVFINFFLIIIFCLVSTKSSSIISFFYKIIRGLNDPASTYYEKVYNSINNQGINTIGFIYFFIYPYMLLIMVLSIFYYKKLNAFRKTICILTLILEACRWIAIGTNKGIFDILILLISSYLLKLCNNEKKHRIEIKYRIIFIIVGLLIFFMFTYFISSRMYVKYNDLSTNEKIEYGIEKITNYIVQGYKGMDYALNLEWKPTFGVGNSMFLTSQVDRILKTNLSERTYAKRAEIYGWSSTVNWHTVYTWMANDIHFIGVIPLMFILGAFFAKIIREIILYNNYYSAALYYMMMIGIFYSSANNQVLSFSNMCIAFIIILILRYLKMEEDYKLNGK